VSFAIGFLLGLFVGVVAMGVLVTCGELIAHYRGEDW